MCGSTYTKSGIGESNLHHGKVKHPTPYRTLPCGGLHPCSPLVCDTMPEYEKRVNPEWRAELLHDARYARLAG